MAGILTIHSSGTGDLMSGHSWIEFAPDGGPATTYGTWGNNPTGKGNGLFQDLELGRSSDASRSLRIDDAQQAKLEQTIQDYKNKGPDGWKLLNPCSGFAAEAWSNTTGQSLSHRSGLISNPSKLKVSIDAANAGDAKKAATPDAKPSPARPGSSRRPTGSSVQPCAHGTR